jgi:hypothetical protein
MMIFYLLLLLICVYKTELKGRNVYGIEAE